MPRPLTRNVDESEESFRARVKAEAQSGSFRRPPSMEVEWDWQHAHRGSPYYNCERCGMPFGANQHKRMVDGQWWPISIEDEISHEELMDD